MCSKRQLWDKLPNSADSVKFLVSIDLFVLFVSSSDHYAIFDMDINRDDTLSYSFIHNIQNVVFATAARNERKYFHFTLGNLGIETN